MDIARFEQLLKQTMGLDAASIGSASVERAVQERVSACRLADERSYGDRLSGSGTELQELIEAVVVPETWFFRDPASFVALARLLRDERSPRQAQGVLRLLSVPCSTGEEPYSMAMALLDAGFPESALRIDAVDISNRALARAQGAVYGRNSFRGSDLAFRDRHFVATAGGHSPADAVQRLVKFRHGNLLDGLVAEAELYDVIFCRNVLIYFDRVTQDRAIAVLGRLLTPCGWLFVGPSETALLSDHVSEGVQAQATGAEQISQALTQLSEAAQQTVDSLRQSGQAIDGLHQAAGGLRSGVSRFKLLEV